MWSHAGRLEMSPVWKTTLLSSILRFVYLSFFPRLSQTLAVPFGTSMVSVESKHFEKKISRSVYKSVIQA